MACLFILIGFDLNTLGASKNPDGKELMSPLDLVVDKISAVEKLISDAEKISGSVPEDYKKMRDSNINANQNMYKLLRKSCAKTQYFANSAQEKHFENHIGLSYFNKKAIYCLFALNHIPQIMSDFVEYLPKEVTQTIVNCMINIPIDKSFAKQYLLEKHPDSKNIKEFVKKQDTNLCRQRTETR